MSNDIRNVVYLDNSSTTRQDDDVTNAMVDAMKNIYGNPSSVHELGRRGEKAIEIARKHIADTSGFSCENIFFTSGGTEADNWAIFSSVEKQKRWGNKIITSAVEHPAVLEPLKKLSQSGFEVIYIPVDDKCNIDMKAYESALSDDVIFISMMAVNNEIGSVFPIEKMYGMKPKNAIFHSDCVQALGKIDIPKADIVTFSGHKLNGPKGIGGICLRDGISISPFVYGGGQERGMRAGTENVPAIVGFGEAARLVRERKQLIDIGKLKRTLKKGLCERLQDIVINSDENSIDNILNVSFLGVKSEVLVHKLEMKGIYVSAASACSSNKKGKSHVLQAMGISEAAIDGTIRFSFGKDNADIDMERIIDEVCISVEEIRRMTRYRKSRG